MEESMKMIGIVMEHIIESMDKSGELPLAIIGIALMYAINAYIKILIDEGFTPKDNEKKKKDKLNWR